MKAGNESMIPTSSLRGLLACGVVAAFGAMACNGAISGEGMTPGGGNMTGGGGTTGGNPGAGATTPIPNPPTAGSTGTGGAGSASTDPGRISIHRLNNLEYDNTIRDLVGVDGMAQKTFQPDEEGEFDNDADAFTMNDARYEQYFNSADTIGETVFADVSPTGLRQTYVYGLVTPACTPSATATACSQSIITAFGQKAWRRPLATAEVTSLVKLATDAIALGETADGSITEERQ